MRADSSVRVDASLPRSAHWTQETLTPEMMTRGLMRTGRPILGLTFVLFGLHELAHVVHPSLPRPGPPWIPLEPWLAVLEGGALLAAGVGLMVQRAVRVAGIMIAFILLLHVLCVDAPSLLKNVHQPGPWTTSAELLALLGGVLVLLGGAMWAATGSQSAKRVSVAGQWIFAVQLLIFGAQHYLYATFVASLIPAWTPWHLFWAYFFGAAFVAAGLALLLRRVATLASLLVGLMFLLWFTVLHVPLLVQAPKNGDLWTSAFIALGMGGAAFSMVDDFR